MIREGWNVTWVRETLYRSSIFQYGFGSRVSTLVTMMRFTTSKMTHGTQEAYKRGYQPWVISVPPVGNRRSSQAKKNEEPLVRARVNELESKMLEVALVALMGV